MKSRLEKHGNSKAFTLAEVLITLGVIGVVAAMTLPTLVSDIQKKVRMHSAVVFSRKLSQAVEVMQALDVLAPHADTASFVGELQNHLKIVKVCDSSHLADCWPSDKLTLYDGKEFYINNATDGESAFLMGYSDPNGNIADYSSENVAFVMADGSTALISYNTRCNSEDPKAMENCIAVLFEINGKAAPNAVGQDAILMNAERFGNYSTPDGSDPIEFTGNASSREH